MSTTPDLLMIHDDQTAAGGRDAVVQYVLHVDSATTSQGKYVFTMLLVQTHTYIFCLYAAHEASIQAGLCGMSCETMKPRPTTSRLLVCLKIWVG